MPSAAVSALRTQGWTARLELTFARMGARTRLVRRRHQGPLMVQRAFYPEEDGTAHLYVLHPPGGVAGGDELEIDVELHSGASALLTTPAATKVYRTRAAPATIGQRLRVRAGASLEWLPQETIAFGGARLEGVTRVELDPSARYAGWEIVCLGRPASNDGFAAGALELRTELWRAGRPLAIDPVRAEGEASARRGAFGWGGSSVYGTLLATGATPELVRALRDGVRAERAGERFSATALGEVLACRYLGSSAASARAVLGAAWSLIRRESFAKPASLPRIWTT